MATIYYTASSLDGFVVDERGQPGLADTRATSTPTGRSATRRSPNRVGALVMGSSTYEWILANQPGDWMYEQPSWVLTHRPEIVADGPSRARRSHGDVAELHPAAGGGRGRQGRLGGRRR